MVKGIAIVLLAITISSCGPSASEKAALQKLHDDSLKAVTEAEIMKKFRQEQDSATNLKRQEEVAAISMRQRDDSIAKSVASVYQHKINVQSNTVTKEHLEKQYYTLQNILVEDNSELTILYDRKNRDAEFHFGWAISDRERTLKIDQQNIDNLTLRMSRIREQMEAIKNNEKKLK